MRSAVLVLLLTMVSGAVWAQELIPSESPLLARSRVVFDVAPDDRQYRLVLGSLRKVNNQWRSETEQTLEGSVSRRTYELRDQLTYREAQALLAAQLDQITPKQVLYRCQGLNCGSSNGWANEVFQIHQLYGLDNYQNYSALSRPTAEGGQIFAVHYLVQRGNRRVYLQEDVIRVSAEAQVSTLADPASIERTLNNRGYFVVPELRAVRGQVEVPEATVNLLLAYFRAYPQRAAHLVGHDYQSGGLSQQTERSKRHAQQLAQALVERGLDAKRISTHGVGSLAPAGGKGPLRVEMLPAP